MLKFSGNWHFFNNHLLAFIAVSFATGIGLSVQFQWSNVSFSIPVLLIILITIFWVFSSKISKHSTLQLQVVITGALFLLLGFYQGTVSSRFPDNTHHIYNLVAGSPKDCVLVGHLHSMPSFDGSTSRFLVNSTGYKTENSKNIRYAQGKVLLRMHHNFPDFPPGTLLAIRATLDTPSRYLTSGTFDYPAYLARKGIWITGYIRSPAQIQPVKKHENLLSQIRYFPEQVRYQVGKHIDSYLAHPYAGLYRAILLGDRSRIPNHVLELFKSTGTMHILAVSGIHVTLIASLLFLLIYWVLRRSEYLTLHYNVKKIAGISCLPFILGYCFLAGMNSPVIRAAVLAITITIAFCSNRPKTHSALIGAAAILILASAPQALFTASFQLSFAAFCTIILIQPYLKKLLLDRNDIDNQTSPSRIPSIKKTRNWLLASLTVSTFAILGTAPITIGYFNRIALIGPFSNLLMEPLICLWSLPLGITSLFSLPLSKELSSVFLQLGGYGFSVALWIAEIFRSIPISELRLASPSLLLYVFYCGTFIYSVWDISHRKSLSLLPHLPFCFCLGLLLLNPVPLFKAKPNQTTIHYLDVGQGSATVIQTSDGKNILIDGGGSSYSETSVGESIIAPFLWQQSIDKLDLIIITHPDADHYNGIFFLLDHFTPTTLWVSTQEKINKQYEQLLEKAIYKGTTIKSANPKDTFLSGDVKVHCIMNLSDTVSNEGSTNNNGLIIKLESGGSTFLFPGDITKEAEALLLKSFPNLRADILLAAHHGSSTSNSKLFLDTISPKLIISSASRSRQKYYPSRQLKEYCMKEDIPLLTTSKQGTITIKKTQEQVNVLQFWKKGENPLRRSKSVSTPALILD